MVLAGLGRRLTNALQSLNHTTVIDEDALKSMLKEICAGMITSTIVITSITYNPEFYYGNQRLTNYHVATYASR